MASEVRMQDLDQKHRSVDMKLQAELKRPTCDDLMVAELKKQKLALKDQMRALRHGGH
ncbi:YdcH family protein [Euryhalocaulis caribicus]|uniref:YdcH family protein n=2 Tax=Euryhalocaulis TaxID=1712422 RepID=UPI0003B76008|nr:DUF465 domain-containing protein [Euryhalocaulis caribicus]MBA4801432.1 DUF465 domain-containing protein [Euryhalocaulis sp.]